MEREKSPEVTQATLLEKVNSALETLGSKDRWKRTPEFLEGYEPLKNKTLVMVDDVRDVLESFIPHLVVATDGKAYFIEYKGQELDELIHQIMEYNPNLVVIDYHLSDDVKGSSVVSTLREQNFTGDAVGFSSDPFTKKQFMEAGVKGVVEKEAWDPKTSIERLAELIAKNS